MAALVIASTSTWPGVVANRFDHFKARVLDRAQAELATTDVPITMEFFRQGKAVRTIRFHFASTIKASVLVAPEEGSWQALLLKTGIVEKSLLAIQASLMPAITRKAISAMS
jgi:hypothetical protein